jgi:hypothetical protein
MSEAHNPVTYLTQLARAHPDCWAHVDELREQRGRAFHYGRAGVFFRLPGPMPSSRGAGSLPFLRPEN